MLARYGNVHPPGRCCPLWLSIPHLGGINKAEMKFFKITSGCAGPGRGCQQALAQRIIMHSQEQTACLPPISLQSHALADLEGLDHRFCGGHVWCAAMPVVYAVQ